MATLYQTELAGVRYEVRTAGASRRLYTDGILHSQFHPERILSGSVWDLLMLGGFFLQWPGPRHILILGVGGGAVIRQLLHYFPEAKITGIELVPLHITLAKQYFGLDDPRVRLVASDAVDWVKNAKPQQFDLIIDDVFGEVGGEPDRAFPLSRPWLRSLEHLARPDSAVTVANVLESKDIEAARRFYQQRRKRSLFRLTVGNCYNIVLIATPAADCSFLRQSLRQFAELDTRKKSCKLQYNIRKIL